MITAVAHIANSESDSNLIILPRNMAMDLQSNDKNYRIDGYL